MSCIITHKGRKYSEEQFKEYFINNKNEFATSISKNKDVIDSFKRKMEAIDGVFKDSPELAAIGSKAQYMQYLSTIFKTSKVKDIVYHGSPNINIESFLSPEKEGYKKQETTTTGVAGIYFSDKKEVADVYQDFEKKGHQGRTYSALINMKKPIVVAETAMDGINEGFSKTILWNIQKGVLDGLRKANVDGIRTGEYARKTNPMGESHEFAVFEPEQIHILGSKKDIEKFKNWIGINNVLPSQKLLDNLQFKKGDC